MIRLFTQWAECVITQDSEQFAKMCMALSNAQIPYKDKIQNIGHGSRRHGQIGSFGENAGYAYLYQIFVKKADLALAKDLLRRLTL